MRDILDSFIASHANLEKGFKKKLIQEKWIDLMGENVNKYTENIYLKHDVLVVKISSSALRMELSYRKEKILKMINENLEKGTIKSIVFN